MNLICQEEFDRKFWNFQMYIFPLICILRSTLFFLGSIFMTTKSLRPFSRLRPSKNWSWDKKWLPRLRPDTMWVNDSTVIKLQACDFSGFFPDFRNFYKSSFAPKLFWKKTRKERSSLYCVQTTSFLFVGMWRVWPPPLNIQEVQEALSSRPKGDADPLPICQDF